MHVPLSLRGSDRHETVVRQRSSAALYCLGASYQLSHPRRVDGSAASDHRPTEEALASKWLGDGSAAEHLYRVAASLESMSDAAHLDTLGPTLATLFAGGARTDHYGNTTHGGDAHFDADPRSQELKR